MRRRFMIVQLCFMLSTFIVASHHRFVVLPKAHGATLAPVHGRCTENICPLVAGKGAIMVNHIENPFEKDLDPFGFMGTVIIVASTCDYN